MANFEPPDPGSLAVGPFPLVPESVSTRDTARRLEQGFFTDPPEALPPEPEYEAEP
jgi:hypothetical protein